MPSHDPIREEIHRAALSLAKLAETLTSRRIRVMDHPPGRHEIDITREFSDAFGAASDALNKADVTIKLLDV